jgi:hypothetical protein
VSVRQGELIGDMLGDASRRWNGAFNGGPVEIADDRLPVVELSGGLRVTILAPYRERLRALAVAWRKESMKFGVDPGRQTSTTEDYLAAPAMPESSAPLGPADSAEAPDESPNHVQQTGNIGTGTGINIDGVEMMAARPFKGDTNVANGSSIAMLIEFEGYSVLVGGDAFAPDLVRSIRTLITARSSERLKIDAFVVPHNGSLNNTSRELLGLLLCSTYLISSSGKVFGHPNDETVARILTYGRPSTDAPLTLIFNYRSESTLKWSSPQLQANLGYEAIYPDSGDGVSIDIVGVQSK